MTEKQQWRIYVPERKDCPLVTRDDRLLSSFMAYNSACTDVRFVSSPEAANLIVLFEEFSFKQADYGRRLLACSLVREFAHILYAVNYDDTAQGFLPGCYTSLRRRNSWPSLHRACCYPRTYNALATPQSEVAAPTRLFSFIGNPISHSIRRAMVEVLKTSRDGLVESVETPFHSHSEEQKLRFAQCIAESKFVLCPRGQSPSTYRLFESMQMGRCPVIISDDWVPIEGIPWNDCSIRVPEKDVSKIREFLVGAEERWKLLGDNALQIYQRHFEPSARFRAYLRMIRELHDLRLQTGSPLNVDEMDRRWRSLTFRWRNEWTLLHKAQRRFRRMARMNREWSA